MDNDLFKILGEALRPIPSPDPIPWIIRELARPEVLVEHPKEKA
jgi:hypothetical protein